MNRNLALLLFSAGLVACATSAETDTDTGRDVGSDTIRADGGTDVQGDLGTDADPDVTTDVTPDTDLSCDAVECSDGEECKNGLCVPSTDTCIDADGDGFGVDCDPGLDCDDTNANANPLAAEVCDEVDNDCNGQTDEGSVCSVGCTDVCTFGALQCSQDARPERCNRGADNCTEWFPLEPCLRGTACDAGSCEEVSANCRDADGDGRGTECALGPDCDDTRPSIYNGALELCDGFDNDCDGNTDEAFADIGSSCTNGDGACEATGSVVCAPSGQETICSASATTGIDELCGNATDDDCDGTVDEGFEQRGMQCGDGTGACEDQGTFVCSADGLSITCTADGGTGGVELCGNSVDDDCDDSVDEGFPDFDNSCSAGQGECARTGSFVCTADLSGTACSVMAGSPAAADLCGNGLDDDCDGSADEGYTTIGNACTVGVGECSRSGSVACSPDRLSEVCSVMEGGPTLEICDGLDNDCDGAADEGGICDVCDDDEFEVNNDLASASPAGGAASDTEIAGVVCFDDVDYYEIGSLAVGEVININLLFSHAAGDLDLELYRDGTFTDFSYSTDDNEQIAFEVATAGTYVVRVENYSADSRVTYDLSWSIIGIGECVDDGYEENDRSVAGTPLAEGDTYYMQLCSGDDDWFDLGTAGGDDIVVNFLFPHNSGDGDLDVELFEGTSVRVGSRSGSDNEQLTYTGSGAYTVRAYSGLTRAETPYRVSRPIPNACGDNDDVFEDNDTMDDAPPLRRAVAQSAFSCPSDDDFYYLGRLTSGDIVDVDLVFLNAGGDIDATLLRTGSASPLAYGYSVTDNEAIDYTVGTTDDFFLRVFTRGSAGSDYTVRYDVR